MNKQQCPQCKSFKIASSKDRAAAIIVTGIIFSVILIGIPAIVWGIIKAFLPTTYTCKSCGYKWNKSMAFAA